MAGYWIAMMVIYIYILEPVEPGRCRLRRGSARARTRTEDEDGQLDGRDWPTGLLARSDDGCWNIRRGRGCTLFASLLYYIYTPTATYASLENPWLYPVNCQ